MTPGFSALSLIVPILMYAAAFIGIYAVIRLAVKHAIEDTKIEAPNQKKMAAFLKSAWFWLVLAIVIFIIAMAVNLYPVLAGGGLGM